MTEPMIRLEPNGKAPILSYNVPEPTSYSGRNMIELMLPVEDFKPEYRTAPTTDTEPPYLKTITSAPLRFMEIAKSDASGPSVTAPNSLVHLSAAGSFMSVTPFAGSVNVNHNAATVNLGPIVDPPRYRVESTLPVSSKLANLDPTEVAFMMESGRQLNVYRSMYGSLTYCYLPQPQRTIRPRLYLIEMYRLSSFLGSYGAGKVLKTFSLLPGEKTKISVESYLKKETDAKSSSSVLDSFTQTSADDFETSIMSEQSDKKNYQETFEYHVEAEAEASWGFGSAKVSGGVKGGTNSAREQFGKNVNNALNKHSNTASAKRDVQINTSYESKEETGEKTSIEREIHNINPSHTLNFIFRQMNQEFISLLHMIDFRIGFFNGVTKREVALYELDSLLEEVIVDDEIKRQEIKTAFIGEMSNIYNDKNEIESLIEEKRFNNDSPNTYLRTKKDLVSIYSDEITGAQFQVPGIILSVTKNVLRTEGVIVESLLGEGDALDHYARQLQDLEVQRRQAKVTHTKAEAERNALINQLTNNNDAEGAKILAELTCPCQSTCCKGTCKCSKEMEEQQHDSADSQ